MNLSRTITSPHNQRVKDAAKLRDRRHRMRQGRFLIDGAREILRAIESRVTLVELFICESFCTSDDARRTLEALEHQAATPWHVTPEVFARLAFGERHEGLVAVGQATPRTLGQLQVPPSSLVTVLVALEKPGNVGAILRSADAAGVGAVVVADPATDLFNPNCIRASLGTAFNPNVAQATSTETIAWLRARGTTIYTAQLDAPMTYTDADYRGEAAIVLGSEAQGLPPEWRDASATPIKLPMLGTADSLNVSAAAAVLFYEALRQRCGHGAGASEGG